jgi:UPF0755 protein
VTDPTPPRRRGRHASPELPSGVPTSAWLASMPSRTTTPQLSDEPGRHPGAVPRGRRAADDRSTGPLGGPIADPGAPRRPHPSEPLPDLPPRPAGAWSRLSSRPDGAADDATVGVGTVPSVPGAEQADDPDPHGWDDDAIGGLEVIGASGSDDVRRRRRDRRDRRAERSGGSGGGSDDPPRGYGDDRPRRRRGPLSVVLSLLVLAALVAGIFFGGRELIALINPASEDYAGPGSGAVEVRVASGDTLSDIARTLVAEDVIASAGPFVAAAEDEPAATGIQPGVYQLRSQMSGASALDLLLDPEARQVTRVTVREGLTVAATLELVSTETGIPLAELQAAAADPAAIGLPPYANGMLEGFLFPATYDVEPDDTPGGVLGGMVARTVQALDALQVPEADRLTVLTKASIVQAEAASSGDMAMVARVLENRLADGMPLQLDTTVNYANGKSGITTTPEDRANPSPYNTYLHTGLPPGAISNPGEQAIQAVLAPAEGDWRFFVVVDPDTGETRFARTAEEHQQNVLLFQQWLREQPGG